MRFAAAVAMAVMLGAGAWAESPGSAESAPQWDDSHMQSLHRETPRTARPRLEGESGYGALVSGNATRSGSAVRELEFTSQREWEQGALSTGSKAKADAAASAGTNASSGSIPRGSSLRAGATSSGRRRR